MTPSGTAAPVTLTQQQITELNQQLSALRHDVNNHLSLMMAAAELIRRKPEAVERMLPTLTAQPAAITEVIKSFSTSFEAALGVPPR